MYRGPGKVIGVIAVAADGTRVRYKYSEGVKESSKEIDLFEQRSEHAKESGMNGIELFRTFVAPRQATIRYIPRGGRYCEQGKEEEMLSELLDRFTPDTTY